MCCFNVQCLQVLMVGISVCLKTEIQHYILVSDSLSSADMRPVSLPTHCTIRLYKVMMRSHPNRIQETDKLNHPMKQETKATDKGIENEKSFERYMVM